MKNFIFLTLFVINLSALNREICQESTQLCITPCCDGNYSTSSGSGACSSHSGVCKNEPTLNNYSLLSYIIDGDTIKFEDYRCRLYGIDTPESQYGSKLDRDVKMCQVSENFMLEAGKMATQFVKDKMSFQSYNIEIKGKDFYGRDECIVYLENNISLNELLIENGYAIAWSEYIDEDYLKKIYLDKEAKAKELKSGLWKSQESVIECLSQKNKIDILEIDLKEGWNLVGVDRDIDNLSEFFNQSCIENIFTYRDSWINKNELKSLNKFDGFWIKSSEKCNLKSTQKNSISEFKIKIGWQLKSLDKNLNDLEIFKDCINSIWIFRDSWKLYNFEIKDITKIFKTEGFWIDGKQECVIKLQ